MKVKKHSKIGAIAAREEGRLHIVSLLWRGQDKFWWNEACADVIEVFGLPGDRFTSHPAMDNMDFHFKSERDADLCRVLLSEKI
jgi:hypothetical protein